MYENDNLRLEVDELLEKNRELANRIEENRQEFEREINRMKDEITLMAQNNEDYVTELKFDENNKEHLKNQIDEYESKVYKLETRLNEVEFRRKIEVKDLEQQIKEKDKKVAETEAKLMRERAITKEKIEEVMNLKQTSNDLEIRLKQQFDIAREAEKEKEAAKKDNFKMKVVYDKMQKDYKDVYDQLVRKNAMFEKENEIWENKMRELKEEICQTKEELYAQIKALNDEIAGGRRRFSNKSDNSEKPGMSLEMQVVISEKEQIIELLEKEKINLKEQLKNTSNRLKVLEKDQSERSKLTEIVRQRDEQISEMKALYEKQLKEISVKTEQVNQELRVSKRSSKASVVGGLSAVQLKIYGEMEKKIVSFEKERTYLENKIANYEKEISDLKAMREQERQFFNLEYDKMLGETARVKFELANETFEKEEIIVKLRRENRLLIGVLENNGIKVKRKV